MSERKGLVIINTGNGKGKTTAALGLLFRAWGRGFSVIMYQYIKAATGQWGEIRAAKKIGVEIIPMGGGFTWDSSNMDQTADMARQCWQLCREKILGGAYDMVIMDEFTYALTYGWLDIAEVLDVLKRRPDHVHVVITGRDAPPELIDAADLVSQIDSIKHPYDAGINAQAGIEF